MAGDGERHVDTLYTLRDMGVRFATDDFRTGYSPLSYLKRLPVGTLEIDRSFVQGVGEGNKDEVLVSGIAHVASGLGLKVLAEGVKTSEQLARVRALGCELAQGYYFSEPVPAYALEALLAARDR